MRFGLDPRRRRTVVQFAAACLAVLLPVSRAAAQTSGTITGTVTGEAGNVLANAQVSLVGTTLGTMSNASGKYTIVNVPAAAYRI